MKRPWKAADVPTGLFLTYVRENQLRRTAAFLEGHPQHRSYYTDDNPVPAVCWDIDRMLPVPPKVLLAKAKRMIDKGYMTGCTCGCRGDYELTENGRALLKELSFV